jgi:hypothetical protein
MTYLQFMDWVEKNLLEGMDDEDFITGLAIGTIKLINHVSDVQGVSVSDVIASMADNFDVH